MVRMICARIVACVSALVLFGQIPPAQAATFRVLHSFSGGTDGCNPAGGSLVLDSSGNLYGTTAGQLCSSIGTVFQLAPDGTKTLLYAFPGGNGGASPDALVRDNSGNLWGTALDGGPNGGGLIFEIDASGQESIVHRFMGQPHDGFAPYGAMVADSSGNFYGTTLGGGKHGLGSVFKLARDGTESLVYSFRGGRDGRDPIAGLTIDPLNDLYGTTDSGGKVGVCPRTSVAAEPFSSFLRTERKRCCINSRVRPKTARLSWET
jgi:uncharacterized repeat protein (TIGR03803 family)